MSIEIGSDGKIIRVMKTWVKRRINELNLNTVIHVMTTNGLIVTIEDVEKMREITIHDLNKTPIAKDTSRKTSEKLSETKQYAEELVEHLCRVLIFDTDDYSVMDDGGVIMDIDKYRVFISTYDYTAGYTVHITDDNIFPNLNLMTFNVMDRYRVQSEILSMIEFLNKTRK